MNIKRILVTEFRNNTKKYLKEMEQGKYFYIGTGKFPIGRDRIVGQVERESQHRRTCPACGKKCDCGRSNMIELKPTNVTKTFKGGLSKKQSCK